MSRLSGGGGASYSAEATTLFAAMSSQPDSTRKTLIDTTITSLKSAGIWTLLDECWFLAAHDSQAALLGWKRNKDCVAVNAPTFTANQGFAGNGTTSYLNTQFVPSLHGVQYTLNDASFGVYSRTNSASSSMADMGSRNASNVAISMFYSNLADGSAVIAVNRGASTTTAVHGAGSTGLWVARRTASNAIQMYRNGSSVATAANVSTALTGRAMAICARMSDATPGEFSTRQYAFAFIGASMTAQQQADLYTIVQAYMTSVGANV